MKLEIEITEKKDIKVSKKNGYYLIRQDKDKFYIYVKYNDDEQLYYMESTDSITDSLIRVYNGYIEVA